MARSSYGRPRSSAPSGAVGCFALAWLIGALLSLATTGLVIWALVELIQYLQRH